MPGRFVIEIRGLNAVESPVMQLMTFSERLYVAAGAQVIELGGTASPGR